MDDNVPSPKQIVRVVFIASQGGAVAASVERDRTSYISDLMRNQYHKLGHIKIMNNFEKFQSLPFLRKMTYQFPITVGKHILGFSVRPFMATNLRQVSAEATDVLDGTAGDLVRFLRELVDMTGQQALAGDLPILELQFGEVLTRSSVVTAAGSSYLSVTALLPSAEEVSYSLGIAARHGMPSVMGDQWEFLWHADNGHYVVERKIPVSVLLDERSVMDAFADTADQVGKWFARLCREQSKPA